MLPPFPPLGITFFMPIKELKSDPLAFAGNVSIGAPPYPF
ncbi:hypothetical protein M2408_002035 [Sphingobacterium sp. BIGb0165]|nr:hypothetical protein [Sphingobacterium sp. BIGb0165]